MKKQYLFALGLTMASMAGFAQNLITNGNFENWTGANPVNFDESGTSVLYNDLITKETTIVMSGNAVKQQSKPQGTTQYLEYGNLVDVTPGNSYTISYWYLDNDTKARTRLWSTWLNSSNTALPTADQNLQEADYSVENAVWQHKTETVTAPAGAAKLRYQIRTYSQDNTDGGFVYFDDLSLIDNTTAGVKDNVIAGLKIYPNPLSGSILTIISDTDATKTVSVYDVLGKEVIRTATTREVNVSALTSGVYVVKITEEGKTATRKLVVQ